MNLLLPNSQVGRSKLACAIIAFVILIPFYSYGQNLLRNLEHVVYDQVNQRYLVTNYRNGTVVSLDGMITDDQRNVYVVENGGKVYHFDHTFQQPPQVIMTRFFSPAGDFDLVMLFKGHSMVEDTIWVVTYKFYYARNVGLVRFTARAVGHDSEKVSELVSYQVR